jgi:hypothetical protein
MEKLKLFFRLLPYHALLYGDPHSSLEVFFPYLRDPDFNRWEVDEGVGSYVQILGWKKTLRPPRVLARGHMSESAARAVGLIAGVVWILIAIFGIRHVVAFQNSSRTCSTNSKCFSATQVSG